MTSSPESDTMASWDAIAESFDVTRRKPWSFVLDYLASLPSRSIVYDLGCGNGRHLIPAGQQHHAVGLDFSRRLLKITKGKILEQRLSNVSLVLGDLTRLPFCDASADAVIFIAALHNIKSRENRVKALQEVARVLKNEGTALITVWSRWQDTYRWHFFRQLVMHPGELGDIEICWRQHRLNVPRFYHLYGRLEFRHDLAAGGLAVSSLRKASLGHRATPDNYIAVVQQK